MENKLQLMSKKFVVMSWLHKDGYECRALCVDLGYCTKMLCYKNQDLAEVFGISVRQLVEATPVIPGKKTRYEVLL